MFGNCFGLCGSGQFFSLETMHAVDKALGNVKKSHKAITFCGLVNFSQKKAVMLHHLADQSGPFCQICKNPNEAGKEAQHAFKIQAD